MSLMTDPKVGYIVGTSTTTSGLGTWLDLIPNDIGKLATLVGILLSVVIMTMHIRKMVLDSRESAARERESKLREELLRAQIEQVRQNE